MSKNLSELREVVTWIFKRAAFHIEELASAKALNVVNIIDFRLYVVNLFVHSFTCLFICSFIYPLII